MLIETDVLLAAINPSDPLRSYASKVLDQANLVLSPFSLLELHLLERAQRLRITDFQAFARDASTLFAVRAIRRLADKPEYHSEATALESKFRLSFFDSLHAGAAKVEAEVIASFDKSYDRLSGAGVKRLDPREL